ncbi:MAG: hypothetical protein PHP98_06650 [Kiritimatiellae bacterium]|nr:hypothetical protein [Kiritimatiellia bacterium]
MNYYYKVRHLLKELARPVHCTSIRNRNYKPETTTSDLSAGYRLVIPHDKKIHLLDRSIHDFHRFMSVAMEVKNPRGRYEIQVALETPKWRSRNASEVYQIEVQPQRCLITSSDVEGMRRALIYLEDEMTIRRAPTLPLGKVSRRAQVQARISRSPCAPYRWQSGWELEDKYDYYPDEYLNKLMHCGTNGIWVAGLFRRLIASKVLPELGPRKHCLEKLRKLTEKTEQYGIKVYLFCIEPRIVPKDHPVFARHPEIIGNTRMCSICNSICISSPLVRNYILEVVGALFQQVPKLAGLINIFNGERGTTCWPDKETVQSCPRCRKRGQTEALADGLNLFYEGMSKVNPSAKMIAWSYGKFDQEANALKAALVKRINPNIVWLENMEHGGIKKICGKDVSTCEYSLSYEGNSSVFENLAKIARTRNRKMYAKLQIGTTYELSSLPYLPLPQTVHRKFAKMHKFGVSGTMESWIIGGYPSLMLKAAGEAAFAPLPRERPFLERLAGIYWGKTKAKRAAKAWEHFSRTFRQYPCANEVFYYGPITRSPAYQLHLEQEKRLALPYNWGLHRNRNVQPHEDRLERWLGPFTPEDLIKSFRTMGYDWNKGVRMIESIIRSFPAGPGLKKQYAVAAAAGLQFLSTANVIEFYQLRDYLHKSEPAVQKRLLRKMRNTVLDDIALARAMKKFLRMEIFIGFESEIYDYSYSGKLLDDKIKQAKKVLQTLSSWQKTGVDHSVLNRIIAGPRQPALTEREKNYKQWIKYGD